ncbi:hypothetical protein NDU88_002817 [Pleurodeles waltl]|uniref:Uncharacterized protein n=1 Tax=Pleurodeles waltl TaxID=8319 RepID=A0AAV7KWQ2_PLEWA|nr:hypothetical protein NDU88_002817 [Pleurodeles waltl]
MRGADRVGEDTGHTWMDEVEVPASEVCVLLGVVMLVVAVDAVHARVSVDVTVREVEEEEVETVEAVDVVVSATVWCLFPLVPLASVDSASWVLWDGAPFAGAPAPPPDDANAHMDRMTEEKLGERE